MLRWAYRLYFAAELKPHLYAVEEEPERPEAEAARLILAALEDGQAIPRSELAAKCDLRGAQTNKLLADLIRRGLVVCAGRNLVQIAGGPSHG